MTDELLVEELQKDPSKGFDLLLKEYSGLVFKICRSALEFVGTNEDAQECSADVFAAVFKNLEKIDLSKGTFKGYLAFLAKTAAIDRRRKLKRENERLVPLENAENDVFAPHAFEESENREQSRIVASAIRALGEPDSTIILRKYFLSETAEEIAKVVSLSPQAVQKRSRRALEKLKKRLGERLGGVFVD